MIDGEQSAFKFAFLPRPMFADPQYFPTQWRRGFVGDGQCTNSTETIVRNEPARFVDKNVHVVKYRTALSWESAQHRTSGAFGAHWALRAHGHMGGLEVPPIPWSSSLSRATRSCSS